MGFLLHSIDRLTSFSQGSFSFYLSTPRALVLMTQITVNWREGGGAGLYPEVYVAKEGTPFVSSYLYANTSLTTTSVHDVIAQILDPDAQPGKTILIPYPAPGSWTVGISSSPLSSGCCLSCPSLSSDLI